MAKTEIDNGIYEQLGERWYTAYDDPVALLRAESKTKGPWIREQLQRHARPGAQILDVGCGAGFLTNELAAHGYAMTGLDVSPESLRVARQHDETKTVTYLTGDAYRLPFPDQSFDAVTAMDFLEHIEDPQAAIREFSRVLRPGGLFFYHTFNRNFLAWLIVIKLVEWVVKNTPKHMHVLRLFIKPGELAAYCRSAGLEPVALTGLRPVLRTITLRSLVTGVVPRGLRFTLTASTLLSYLGMAKKESSSAS